MMARRKILRIPSGENTVWYCWWDVWCGVVWCGVVWCGVVWCGVVWCGVVWCGVVWYGMVWYRVRGMVWCGMVWYGMVWYGMVWCGVVWCGVVWCGVVWCGVVWYGMVWYGMAGSFIVLRQEHNEIAHNNIIFFSSSDSERQDNASIVVYMVNPFDECSEQVLRKESYYALLRSFSEMASGLPEKIRSRLVLEVKLIIKTWTASSNILNKLGFLLFMFLNMSPTLISSRLSHCVKSLKWMRTKRQKGLLCHSLNF